MASGLLRSRRAWAVVLTLAALAAFLALVGRFEWLCDDAFISFRYAKNFARGDGLVWNVGESPRVEGYSNLLWVLWVSLGERLGLDVRTFPNASSAVAGGLLVLLVARSVGLRDGLAGLAGALVVLATATPLAVWSTGGLATAPFALFLFGSWDALVGRERPRPVCAALWGAAACLVRADGPGFALPLVVLVALCGHCARRPELGRAAWRTALALGLLTLALTGWRVAYYGDWLPNTARAKVALNALTLERGAAYLAANALAVLTFPLAWILGLFGRRSVRQISALFVVLGCALYAVLSGGDFMPMGRLLVPVWPFLAVLVAEPLGHLARCGVPARLAALTLTAGLAALSLTPAWNVHVVPAAWRARCHFRWNTETHQSEYDQWFMANAQSTRWRALGRQLQKRTAPDASFIMGTIGAAGYYSDRTIYDTFGLTNRLGEEAERKRRSPGHDRAVPIDVLVALHPTYLNANLVPESDPYLYLPGFLRPGEPLAARAEFEWIPLQANLQLEDAQRDEELPSDAMLRLVRYRP